MDDDYYRVAYCTFCGIELVDGLEDEIEWDDEDE